MIDSPNYRRGPGPGAVQDDFHCEISSLFLGGSVDFINLCIVFFFFFF